MLYRITSNTDSHVLSDKREVDIERETPKSISNHRSQVTSAVTRTIAHNSASALERETATCFLVFQKIWNHKKNTIDRKRTTVRVITKPGSITICLEL
jgi:Tol biopolymer transport system component